MGFNEFVEQYIPIPKRKIKIGKRSQYSLTPLGKIKTESFSIENKVAYNVSDYLNENGASSVGEIASGLHESDERVTEALKRLLASGYVTTSTTQQ